MFSSNLAILAFYAANVAANWNHDAFRLFLTTKLKQVWPFLLLTEPAFMLIMPFVPKPRCVTTTTKVECAAKPTIGEAKLMAISTAAIDYLVVGALLLFWDTICRLEDGSICPFTAAGTLLVGFTVMSIKDDIQCRFLWKKFISPYKLNSWPHTWQRTFDIIFTSPLFSFLACLGLCLSGWVSFESIKNPKVLLQVQLESMVITDGITNLFMMFGHKWLHDKLYFLHRKHHKASNKCLMIYGAPQFDLLDMVIEFGAGVPGLIVVKKILFGPSSKVHFLTYGLFAMKAFQTHSGNPYSPVYFVPLLDHLARTTICHNLHHVIQNDYFSIVPHQHLWNPEARKRDIDLYNKHLMTQFPRSV